MTLLTYAVLDVSEPVVVKLEAPYSVAGRLQVVLGGMPVEHKEVVALEKGLYPMLSVLRLDGPNWGGITPHFQIASPELVEQAKALQKDKDALAAERARILKEGIKNKTPVVRPYADVPEERRKHMFWVADEEQARAWFKLHTQKIHGQAFPGP